MRLASEAGVRVLNEPAGLQKASSKLYTVCLPQEFVPRTLVCHTLHSVQEFAEQLDGPLVIKPLLGSQGRDVFFFDGASSLNTRQVVDILGRTGYLVVQEYLPEATEGDIRVLTLDKSIVNPKSPIGIRRTPAEGEIRSNVSLGGKASMVNLTARQASVCNQICEHLFLDGIRFAGLDLIGEKVVEVNVFSPSGLQEYDRQSGSEISIELVDRLLK
jgi:glutathione synthase